MRGNYPSGRMRGSYPGYGSAAEEWAPDSLSGLIVWLDAAQGTYQNTAASTPAGNGHTVARWNNLADSNYLVAQAGTVTVSSGGQNGKTRLVFSGSSMKFITEYLDLLGMDAFLVVKRTADSHWVACYTSSVANTSPYIHYAAANIVFHPYRVGSASRASAVVTKATGGNGPILVNCWLDSTTVFAVDVNASGTPGKEQPPPEAEKFTVGSLGYLEQSTSADPSGELYELIVYNRMLNSTERALVSNWLNEKYALY